MARRYRADPYQTVMEQAEWRGDCLVWTGMTRAGYGRVSAFGKKQSVHRVVAAHHFGPSDLDVMHSCDNPICVRIEHLSYGTHADNMADMRIKERVRHKLTPAQVAAIRTDPRPQWVIADEHGISRSYVSELRSGRKRPHI
jgi:hypothetical protein